MSDQGIERLADSIRRNGIIQPVVLRPAPATADGGPGGIGAQVAAKYELIAGERRVRAARAAGLTEIPAIVRDVTEQQSLELALVENIQREGLNPMDRALAYQDFRDQFGLTAEQIGLRVGEDRTTVTNYLRLLELADVVRDMVASDLISMGHARALAGLRSKQEQQTLAEGIVRKGLSVRALEDLIRRRRGGGPTGPTKQSNANKKRPLIRDLERRFSQALQTKVTIHEASRKGHGKLIIEYHSLDGFESICERLGI